jgi:hypothetical protein
MIRPIDNLFKDAFKLVIRHWLSLLCIQLALNFLTVIVVIGTMLIFFGPLLFNVIFTAVGGGSEQQILGLVMQFFKGNFWYWMGTIILFAICMGAYINVALIGTIGYEGEGAAPVDFGFKQGFKFFFPAVMLLVSIYCILYGGLYLLIFPAMIFGLALSFSFYIMIGQKTSFGVAMATSWQMTKGYRWGLLGRWIVVILAVIMVQMVVQLLAMIPIIGIGLFPVMMAVGLIINPFLLAYGYLMYRDVRQAKGDIVVAPSAGFTLGMIVMALVGFLGSFSIGYAIWFLIKKSPGWLGLLT